MSSTPPDSSGIAHKLARPNILKLHPYRCARDDYDTGILLDANENAFGAPAVQKEKEQQQLSLHRYPDPYQRALKQRFLEFRGYEGATPAHMFCGVGSDEAIDLLFRIFCTPAVDSVITTPPTYGMYKVCAAVNDVAVVPVPLMADTFQVPVQEVIDTALKHPESKLIFLCSPGNPTAKSLRLEDIKTIATATKDTQLVVVDEAYVDFATSSPSAVTLLKDYPNICVLQTLSKAVGLAAIRCGFLFGSPDVIQLLNNVKAPYNVNALTSAVAQEALTDHAGTLKATVQTLVEQRGVVMEALEKLPCVIRVYPSDANFILFRLQLNVDAEQVYKQMADRGVVTRFRGKELHCTNCLRVTVGTAAENEAFLALLVTVVEEQLNTK